MNIVITYASTGSGHLKAAEAIYNYFREHNKDQEVDLVDTLKKGNALFRLVYSKGYDFLVRYAPFLWRLLFWMTHFRTLRKIARPVVSFIGQINLRDFEDFLAQKNPDFIISTHFLSSEISSHLKKRKKIKSKLITVITDFGVHPFWISAGTDLYIVATDFSKEQLISYGVEEDRIKDLGIPTDAKFLKQYNKFALCERLRLKDNEFTVLIVTGSFGIGPIEEIVEMLHNDVQLIVICANNRRLYRRLEGKNYINLRLFGFIDNPEELLSASDVIITKPGGLTISEILVTETVPIFISAIPGQEIENIKILRECGIGTYLKKTEEIKDLVLNYQRHPERLEFIKVKMRQIKKPSAARDICHAVC